jgi:integrase/recombinase XerD
VSRSDARFAPRERAPSRSPLPRAHTEALSDFLEALRVEVGLSRHTLTAYGADLKTFLAFAAAQGARTPEKIRASHIVDWLGVRREGGLAEATVARGLAAVRMLMRHLVMESRISRDPSALIAAPSLRQSLPRTLAVEEVEQLLDAPSGQGWKPERDRALLEVLYACGARVSEAVGLRTGEIEPSLRVLRLTGKGSKTRIVPLGERARRALEAWMSGGRTRRPGAARTPQVFLTKSGRPMTRLDAWRAVKAAAARAGLPTDISPHTLRHSFATHMVEGGADLRSVQEMLGHASIRTTEVYTHLDTEHVTSTHRLFHPRG